MATTFPTITQAQFAQRLAALFPRNWANAGAVQSGNFYFFLSALSSQIVVTLNQMTYALNAMRIGTETYPELDNASVDFFGSALPRTPGNSDAVYRAQIEGALFPKVATRSALIALITQLTGTAPRMIEPWNPGDTGCRDTLVTYRDIDTAANPSVNTDGFLAYNGFILAKPLLVSTQSNNPFLTRDETAYRDTNEYRVDPASVAAQTIYSAVQSIKAYGTVVWIQTVTSMTRN